MKHSQEGPSSASPGSSGGCPEHGTGAGSPARAGAVASALAVRDSAKPRRAPSRAARLSSNRVRGRPAPPRRGYTASSCARAQAISCGRAGAITRSEAVLRSGGAIPGHRRPVHHAPVLRLVPGATAVEHAAVVPHDQIARLPAVCVDQLRMGDGGHQLPEQGARRVRRHADDLARVGADVEGLSAIHGIRAH